MNFAYFIQYCSKSQKNPLTLKQRNAIITLVIIFSTVVLKWPEGLKFFIV